MTVAIAGIPPELYEAAVVDGANRFQKIFYITLPSIAGVPVLIDNFLPTNEDPAAAGTSIYAVTLGEDVGLCGIYPSAHEGAEIQIRGPIVKESTDTMWFHIASSPDWGMGKGTPG